MSADVDLDAVGSDTLLLLCGLHVIYVLLLPFPGSMNSTLRPTSRLVDGVKIHAHGDLTGDPRVVTPRELSPEEAASSRQIPERHGRTDGRLTVASPSSALASRGKKRNVKNCYTVVIKTF